MDITRQCTVCNKLDSSPNSRVSGAGTMRKLMETVDGSCQICRLLRCVMEAQPRKPSLSGLFFYNLPEFGSPLVLTLTEHQADFYIYSDSESTSRALSIPIGNTRNGALKMNNDEDSFNFIRRCLTKCTAGHQKCEGQPVSPLPRRLLHISASKLALVETQGELGKYAALSYCWGTESQNHLRTLSSNLDKMKKGISWGDLPPVFRDALTVLNNLGIEMVWIDSLCIVQDSVRDWEMESSKMAQYYADAYFTIAADSSDNPNVPFLGRLHPVYQPLRSSVGPHTIFYERILSKSDFFSTRFNALPRRGWALQESALSKRILHYQACGLVWECRSIVTSQHDIDRTLFLNEPDGAISRTFGCLLTLGYDKEQHYQWMDLVRDYSSRRLTLQSDKLPAFSGLASAVAQKTGWTYLAGHWEENLPTSLCWRISRQVPFPTPIPAREGLPSWSWASVNGSIDPLGSNYHRPSISLKVCATVLGSGCIPAGLNPFGQTRGGWVTLQGQITVACLSFDSSAFSLRPMTNLAAPPTAPLIDTLLETCDCTTPIFHGEKTLCRRPSSATNDLQAFQNVFVELLLILRLDGFERELRRCYLVLGRSQTVNGAHVRLGLLDAPKGSWKQFSGGELKTPIVVTII